MLSFSSSFQSGNTEKKTEDLSFFFFFLMCALEVNKILKDSLQHGAAEGYPSLFWNFHKSIVNSVSKWHSVRKGWRKGNCSQPALGHTTGRNSSARNTAWSRSFLNTVAVQADQSKEWGTHGGPCKENKHALQAFIPFSKHWKMMSWPRDPKST